MRRLRRLASAADAWLSARSRLQLGSLSALLLLFVFALDCATTAEISLTVFYFAPIFLSCWYLGSKPGWTTALASTVAWELADLLTRGRHFRSSVDAWNTVMTGAVFFTNAASALALKDLLAELAALRRRST